MTHRFMKSCISSLYSVSKQSCLLSVNPMIISKFIPGAANQVLIIGGRSYANKQTESFKNADDEKPIVRRDPRIRHPTPDDGEVSVETSMRYLKSEGYRETYGDKRIWVMYRRNFKGQFAPKRTAESCYRAGKLNTGNPCPICRDEYLVLDYRNVDLLKQFISPFNGAILGTDKTGLCRETHFKLLAEIDRAWDYGTISFDSPFREFNYEQFYSKEVLDKLRTHLSSTTFSS